MLDVKKENGKPVAVFVGDKELNIIETSDVCIWAQCDLEDIGDISNNLFPDSLVIAIWEEKGIGSPMFKEVSISKKSEGIRLEFSFRASSDTWEGRWNLDVYKCGMRMQAEKMKDIQIKDMRLQTLESEYQVTA